MTIYSGKHCFSSLTIRGKQDVQKKGRSKRNTGNDSGPGVIAGLGCANRQQAVALYVDAVELRELNDNDKAIAKLNQAAKVDERFRWHIRYWGRFTSRSRNIRRARRHMALRPG